jgi:FkbM family methyltransferase
MKKFIKSVARRFGYSIHRIDDYTITIRDKDKSYPYVETFTMSNICFKYWITDDIYKAWYNPQFQSNWCVNDGYLKIVKKLDKVLEIGCNNGFTTCLIKSAIGQDALIVGMDVIPINCMIANAQIGLNAFMNCHILNIGAANANGVMMVRNVNNGCMALEPTDNTIEVEVIMCDDLIDKYGYFDVVKIDVEGFETSVLKGSANLLSKMPKLIIELHGKDLHTYGSNYEELFDIICVNNYEGYMYRDPNSPHATNTLEEFNADVLIRNQVPANLFLIPKNRGV